MNLLKKQNNAQSETSELTQTLGTCGCGKPIRYATKDGKGACNKYGRCPTYDELQKILEQANLKLYQIQQILQST